MEISEDADVTHHHLICELLQSWRHSLFTTKSKSRYDKTHIDIHPGGKWVLSTRVESKSR